MNVKQLLRTAVVGALVGSGVAVGMSAPAQADTSEQFYVCDATCFNWTSGTITWHNRTATVSGTVYDEQPGAYTTAIFEAFAGSTKIDSATRTANDESDLGWARNFSFSIGDPNKVGGINRIKITVCWTSAETRSCGPSENYIK